jgi:hypothetical protein
MRVFNIEPASDLSLLATILGTMVITIILILVLGMVLFAFYASKNAKFTIKNDSLKISASLYSRTIPLSEMEIGRARIMENSEINSWKPKLKTNGIGLFGYHEGWFKLENGKKALMFSTNKKNKVIIPMKDDYFLLLSPMDADEFIAALREVVF